jgi:hypothetical protein
MNKIERLAAVCLLAVPAAAFASGTATGTVTHVYTTVTWGDLVYVELSGAKSGNPTCSTKTPWQFMIPLSSGSQYGVMLGMIMAAQAGGKTITITGQGVCNVDDTEETIGSVTF